MCSILAGFLAVESRIRKWPLPPAGGDWADQRCPPAIQGRSLWSVVSSSNQPCSGRRRHSSASRQTPAQRPRFLLQRNAMPNTPPYLPLTSENAALVLVDHQV